MIRNANQKSNILFNVAQDMVASKRDYLLKILLY